MKLDFKNLGSLAIGDKIKNNVSLLLLIVLGIIALMAGFVMFKEVRRVSQVRTDTSAVTGQIVRVNVTQHQAIEQKLEENLRFTPEIVPNADAFGSAPVIAPKQ
jgi:hypothetical protein